MSLRLCSLSLFLVTFYFPNDTTSLHRHQQMNQELSVKRDRSPSPPPPMSPLNSPKQRRIFLTLIMRNTQTIPPHLRIDRIQPIMCQLFKYFNLYEEGAPAHGFYCGYGLNFEEGDFHF